MKITIIKNNGKWLINEKPYCELSDPEKDFFDAFIREMKSWSEACRKIASCGVTAEQLSNHLKTNLKPDTMPQPEQEQKTTVSQTVTLFDGPDTGIQEATFYHNQNWINAIHNGHEISMSVENWKKFQDLINSVIQK